MPALYRSFTALWLGGAGDLYIPYDFARRGIWYNQPQSGLDYPIVFPSEDIRYLVADAYLSYMDPTDDDSGEEYQHPLSIYWMFGFGDLPDPPLGEEGPIPAHVRDIIIKDATGRTVFDSTLENTEYEFREWAPWLHITRWQSEGGNVFSIVTFDTWGVDSFPERRRYPENFFPQRAELQSQCVQRIPQRVRSLFSLFRLNANNYKFKGENNMELTVSQQPATNGGRIVTVVTFDATPGGGAGRYKECNADSVAIRTINGIQPTETGQFTINADGCYFARQPYRLLNSYPRVLLPEVFLDPGGDITFELALPDDNAGTTTEAAGWPADIRYAHLQFGNDCGPCCSCDDYIAVAEYIEKQHARYAQIGKDLSEARDIYHVNRTRWLDSRECLQEAPVRVVVLSQACPFVDIAVQVCNQTEECMVDIDIETTITTVPPGGTSEVLDGYTFITGPTIDEFRQIIRTRRGSVDSDGTSLYHMQIEQLPPMTSGSVKFRLSFADCGGTTARDGAGSYQIIASAIARADGKQINDIPATASDVLNCPTTVTAPPFSCTSAGSDC